MGTPTYALASSNRVEKAMQRLRIKQVQSLEERLAQQSQRLREEAKLLPPGTLRETLLRTARQCETGSHMNEWLSSPGLRSPK